MVHYLGVVQTVHFRRYSRQHPQREPNSALPGDAFPVAELRIPRFGHFVFPVPGFRIPCSGVSYSLFVVFVFPVLRFQIPCSADQEFARKPGNSAAPQANSAPDWAQKSTNSLLISRNSLLISR
jgi:hypothetical protein